MPVYSMATAKDQLPKLLEDALAGLEVSIAMDHGEVIELRPRTPHPGGRISSALIDEIAARARLRPPLWGRAEDIVREMRDEDA